MPGAISRPRGWRVLVRRRRRRRAGSRRWGPAGDSRVRGLGGPVGVVRADPPAQRQGARRHRPLDRRRRGHRAVSRHGWHQPAVGTRRQRWRHYKVRPAAPARCWTCRPGRRRTVRRSCSTRTTAARTSCSGWLTRTAGSSDSSTSQRQGGRVAGASTAEARRSCRTATPARATSSGELARVGTPPTSSGPVTVWLAGDSTMASFGRHHRRLGSGAQQLPHRGCHRGQQRRRWAQRADLAVRVGGDQRDDCCRGVRAVLHRLRHPMAVDARRIDRDSRPGTGC